MPPSLSSASTLPQWIGKRAEIHGQRIAITHVRDDRSETSWTYEQLWRRACAVAERLPKVDEPSPRALLLYPPGIEFLAGFLGCEIAGWTPVPTCYPRGGREMTRLNSAASDCQPSALVGDRESVEGVVPDRLCDAARSLPRVNTDADQDGEGDGKWIDPDSLTVGPESLALLQYTSGSTSEPKGVKVRQRNMMANLEAIRRGFHIDWQDDNDQDPDCGVFWLPFFHDMGLVGGILEPLYVGGRTILLSPRSFLQRPIRWLQGISDYRAVISGAPNFAYQLCVDRISPDQTDRLDLTRWRIAFSGAEPVMPRTLQDFATRFSTCGFSPSAFHPCYGMAEATLLAACGDGPSEPRILSVDRDSLAAGSPIVVDAGNNGRETQKLVNCGHAAHQTDLVIVDPAKRQVVSEQSVGEIWLRGPSVTDGYWNRDEENESLFNAALSDGRAGFCRTGDLGFLHEGDLFVTGRLKDLIIIGGRNLFPQDIEATVRETVGSQGGQCAAFAVEGARSEALVIVAELPRRAKESTYPDLVRAIRRAVIEIHEVDPQHVLLVRQATVPLTSSGKVQRSRCRESFEADQLKSKYRYDRSFAGTQTPIPIPDLPAQPQPHDRSWMITAVESWMTEWLVARAGVRPDDVDLERPFAEYGLDSMTAVEMSGEIEDWSGVELTPVVAWNYPNVSRLSSYIVDELIGGDREQEPEQAAASLDPDAADLESLLDEVEQLSDEEIEREATWKAQNP